MYDMDSLKKEFTGLDVRIALLEELNSQISAAGYPDKIEICLQGHYSSKLKKKILNRIGYYTNSKKIRNEFLIKKK